MILIRDEVNFFFLPFIFKVHFKEYIFDHTKLSQMVGTIALVRVTIGYINLLFGLKALNIMSKECLGELKNIYLYNFYLWGKIKICLSKSENIEFYPLNNRVEIIIFKNPLTDCLTKILRWLLLEKKVIFCVQPFYLQGESQMFAILTI